MSEREPSRREWLDAEWRKQDAAWRKYDAAFKWLLVAAVASFAFVFGAYGIALLVW